MSSLQDLASAFAGQMNVCDDIETLYKLTRPRLRLGQVSKVSPENLA